MKGEKKERWMELAAKVAEAQNFVELGELITELNQLLREKYERLHSDSQPKMLGATVRKKLTSRELEILSQMAQGKSNKEIGLAVGLSEGTVKVHMSHIMWKLKAHSRLRALAVATAYGLVPALVTDDRSFKAA